MLGLTAKAGAGEVSSDLSRLPSHCPGGSTERVPGQGVGDLVTEGLSPRQRSSGNGIVMAPEPGSDGKEEVNNVQDTGPTGCWCSGSRMGRWIRLEAVAVEWGMWNPCPRLPRPVLRQRVAPGPGNLTLPSRTLSCGIPIVRDTQRERVPTCYMRFSPDSPVGPDSFLEKCVTVPEELYCVGIYLEEIHCPLEIIFLLRRA